MTTKGAISEVTKIGNYAITAFAAFVAAGLAVGNSTTAVIFAIYTVVSAHIAYGHRLAYLRNKKKHGDDRNLPTWAIGLVFVLHLATLVALILYLWLSGNI